MDDHVSNGALKLDDVLELLDGIERQVLLTATSYAYIIRLICPLFRPPVLSWLIILLFFLTFQIEDLRSSCQALIGEKASLLKTLSTVSALSSSESTLSEVDRGELVTTSERLKFRLESVNIELVVKR